MTTRDYLEKTLNSEVDLSDREALRREGLRWREYLDQHAERGEPFQSDFVRTLMELVRDRSPTERLSAYQRVWENGRSIDEEYDIHAMVILHEAAKLTYDFGAVYKRPAAMDKVRDLFSEAEELMRQSERLDLAELRSGERRIRETLFTRYAFLRAHYPGLIEDAEMGK